MSLRMGGLSYQNAADQGSSGNSQLPVEKSFSGFVRYYDNHFVPGNLQFWTGGQMVQFQNNGTMNTMKTYISSDLKDHDFMVNDRFWPHKVGDTYLLRLSFNVQSEVLNNSMTVQLVVPSNPPIIVQQDHVVFMPSAGAETRVTMNYNVFCLESFKNFGGVFQGWCENDAMVWNVGLLIIPVSEQ